MNEQVEMDCEPLDLSMRSRLIELESSEEDKIDSGFKSNDLGYGTTKSGCDSITVRLQRDLSINPKEVEEHCVSFDEGYSSESLHSGDREKIKLSFAESWKRSEKSHPISEENDISSEDAVLEEVFTQDDDGDTQMHSAIINYMLPYFLYLISFVKDPEKLNIKNYNQQTSLHLGVHTKQPLVVRKLMASGADVDIPDRNGNTALHIAAKEGHTLVVKALTEPITKEEQDEVAYEIPYVRIPQNLEIRNYDGQVCLHLAAEENHQEIMEVLLDKGANINQRDGKSGRTVLHYAAESGNVSLLQFLLRYPSLDINASTYGGQTPLMLAKGRGHDAVTEILRSARAQYDSSDESVEDEEMSEDSNEENSVSGMQTMKRT